MIEPVTSDQMRADYLLALDKRGWVTIQKPTPTALAVRYAVERGLDLRAFFGGKRTRDVVRPRQDCMLMLRRNTKLSLEQIGKIFSNRDHTTVMNAIKRAEAREAEKFNEEVI